MKKLWRWLSDEKHQKTVAFIGGGLVVVVGGLWQGYAHFSKLDPKPAPATSQNQNQGGIQASGDVNIGAGAQVDASSKIFITKVEGVDPTEHKAIADKLLVSELALSNFFKILGEAKIAPEDLDHKLREIATKHKALLARLDAPDAGDDAVRELKAQARKAIDVGDYNLAEKLLNQASDKDAAIGKERMRAAAASKADIAELKWIEFKYADAADYYQQAHDLLPGGELELRAEYLNLVGGSWHDGGRYAEALPALQQSLALREKALGPEHPDVATDLNNLAALYHAQGAYAKAEPLYQRSLKIWEKALGLDHPDVAQSLNNLAALYHAQGAYAKAEPLYQRSLKIKEKVLGPEHAAVATSLNNLAELYRAQGAYAKAEPLFRRGLKILEKTFPNGHPNLATGYENYAVSLRKLKRDEEALEYETKAQAMQAKFAVAGKP